MPLPIEFHSPGPLAQVHDGLLFVDGRARHELYLEDSVYLIPLRRCTTGCCM